MGLLKKIKNAWNNYLASIAEENKKSFGEGKLDCCQMNRKNTTTK